MAPVDYHPQMTLEVFLATQRPTWLVTCAESLQGQHMEISMMILAPNEGAAKSAAFTRWLTQRSTPGGEPPDSIRFCGVISVSRIAILPKV